MAMSTAWENVVGKNYAFRTHPQPRIWFSHRHMEGLCLRRLDDCRMDEQDDVQPQEGQEFLTARSPNQRASGLGDPSRPEEGARV